MSCIVKGITKQSFNDVVTMVHETIGAANPLGFTRAAAQQFVVEAYDSTFVLYRNGMVFGAYAYHSLPNVYSLNFFSLNKHAQKTKCGYKLYLDMKKRLSGRPVNVTIYNNNDAMIDVVKKRGVFVGRTPSVGGTSLDFYSIMFDDFTKKDSK